jgi:large subunit ribosomal protein L3
MSLGVLGTKVGMTSLFDDGKREAVPVTVIRVEPNLITRHRTQGKDGYSAVQVGVQPMKATRANRPDAGQMKAASEALGSPVEPRRVLREWRLEADPGAELAVGKELTLALLSGASHVDVCGISKGKGTQGVMKLHKFAGFENSHGTHEYFRHGGSIGTRLTPGHVFRGKRMPARMGNVRVTIQNLKLHSVDAEKNLVFVVGAVPGPQGALLSVKPAVKKSGKKKAKEA